jgi:uncharacterized damage-inducible protein DinB
MSLDKNVTAALTKTLEKLRDEINQLVEPLSEQQFWTRPTDPGNSAGHLCLHLTGNLNHFVGAQIGGSGYVRDREREFTEPERVPKAQVLAGLDEAVATFRRVVERLDAAKLTASHAEPRFGTVLEALMSVVTHFALHRGQMSYIERLVQPPARDTAVHFAG